MFSKKSKKTALSEELEKCLFSKRLHQNEGKALRRFCETYQEGQGSKWKVGLFEPYSQYFGFLTALKNKSAIQELENYAYLDILKNQEIQVIDIGAGSLGASLGALDALQSYRIKSLSIVESDESVSRWAAKKFSDFLPHQIDIQPRWPRQLKPGAKIVLFSNVLTELGLYEKNFDPISPSSPLKSFDRWIDEASEDTIFIFIEPASFTINQNLLKLRDHWLRSTNVLLPCTHQLACPALKDSEWCHELRSYAAPTRFWSLVKALGFRKSQLTFSYLCLGKQANAFQSRHARVVSQDLSTKGKCEKYLCADGRRWKASKLERAKSQENESFYEALRGGIIDWSSTDSGPSD